MMESNNILSPLSPTDKKIRVLSSNKVNLIQEVDAKYKKRLLKPLHQNPKLLSRELVKQADKESNFERDSLIKKHEQEANLLNKIGEINLISQYHDKRFEIKKRKKIDVFGKNLIPKNDEIPLTERIRTQLMDRKMSTLDYSHGIFNHNHRMDVLSTKPIPLTKFTIRTSSISNELLVKKLENSNQTKENSSTNQNQNEILSQVLKEKILDASECEKQSKTKRSRNNAANHFTLIPLADISNDENLFKSNFLKLKNYVGALEDIVEKTKRRSLVAARVNSSPLRGIDRNSLSIDKSCHEYLTNSHHKKQDIERKGIEKVNLTQPDLLKQCQFEVPSARPSKYHSQTNRTLTSENDNLLSPRIKRKEYIKTKFSVPKISITEVAKDHNDGAKSTPTKIGRPSHPSHLSHPSHMSHSSQKYSPLVPIKKFENTENTEIDKNNEFIIKTKRVMSMTSNNFKLGLFSQKNSRKSSLAENMGLRPKKNKTMKGKSNSTPRFDVYNESQTKVQQMISNFYDEGKQRQKTLNIEDGTNYILKR